MNESLPVDSVSEPVRPYTVLVVDDEEYIQKFVGIKLKVSGFQVLAAGNGLQALDIVKGGLVDLVVTDLLMPQLDGIQLIKRLREFSDIPIIVLSALESCEKKFDALTSGANEYIAKPFDPNRLVARIADIQSKKQHPNT